MPIDDPKSLENAAQLILSQHIIPDHEFSQQVSDQLFGGRPVLPVSLNRLPHALSNPNHATVNGAPTFNHRQIQNRSNELRAIAETELPHAFDFWTNWNFYLTAAVAYPNCSCLRDQFAEPKDFHSLLKPRMMEEGNCWTVGGIVFTPDTNWTAPQMWSHILGVREHQLSNLPSAEAVAFYLKSHEFAHISQRRGGLEPIDFYVAPPPRYFRQKWYFEKDADKASVDLMNAAARLPNTPPHLARDLRETAELIPASRAFNGIISASSHYWSALALDDLEQERIEASAERCRLVGFELRWRLYNKISERGDEDPLMDSLTMQTTLDQWLKGTLTDDLLRSKLDYAFDNDIGKPFDWKSYNKPEQVVPALFDLLGSNVMTDGHAVRAAELALKAAERFFPQLLPQPSFPTLYSFGQRQSYTRPNLALA